MRTSNLPTDWPTTRPQIHGANSHRLPSHRCGDIHVDRDIDGEVCGLLLAMARAERHEVEALNSLTLLAQMRPSVISRSVRHGLSFSRRCCAPRQPLLVTQP